MYCEAAELASHVGVHDGLDGGEGRHAEENFKGGELKATGHQAVCDDSLKFVALANIELQVYGGVKRHTLTEASSTPIRVRVKPSEEK